VSFALGVIHTHMRKCTYCGQEYSDEATVCSRCGRTLVDPTAPGTPPIATVKYPGHKSKAIGVALAFICCPIGLFYSSPLGTCILVLAAAFVRRVFAKQPSLRLLLWLLLMTCSAFWASAAIDAYNKGVRAEKNPEKALSDLKRNRIATIVVFVLVLSAVQLVRFFRLDY